MPLRQRGGVWHYRFKIDGATFEGSTRLRATEPNRRVAEKVEEQRRREVVLGEVSTIRQVRFSDAWRLFLRAYEGEVKASSLERIAVSGAGLTAFFGVSPVHLVTAGDIEDFKSSRRANHIKEVTIRHDLHAMSLFLQYARKKKWLSGNPLEDVKIPSDKDAIRENVLSADQERAYFGHAIRFPLLYDVARLMLQQGLRPEEAQRVAKVDVDLAAGTLRVRYGKTAAAGRTLILTSESALILGRRMAGASAWIFPSPRGKGKDVPVGRLNNAHDQTCISSDVSCTLYDMRHTFATRLAATGCDPFTLARILGHSGLRCIMRYVHPETATIKAAMGRFDAAQASAEKERAN